MDSRIQAQFQQMQRGFQAQQVPRTVTAADTLRLTDYLVACDATSAGFTLTLPAVKDAKGMSFLVVKTDSSANAVTLDGNGSETINGATTQTIGIQYGSIGLYCDGSAWYSIVPVLFGLANLAWVQKAGTYTPGDTTPSVKGVSYLRITNAGATTITQFDDAVDGQVITLEFADANTTITRVNAFLAGGVNFTSGQDDVLTLRYRNSQWYEMARSVNA